MYNGSMINTSPTIVGVAGENIAGGPFTAVTFKDDVLVQAEPGDVPVGILLAETDDIVTAGDDVNVQIAASGRWKAGSALKAGEALATDQNGCAVRAADGEFILAFAMEAATAAGQVISVQITKSGFMPAAKA